MPKLLLIRLLPMPLMLKLLLYRLKRMLLKLPKLKSPK